MCDMLSMKLILSLAIILFFIIEAEAQTPLFLQAITSALQTIPFTGGPMTTGLAGAKLGIGTKLLYYLGYFGKRSAPKTKPKTSPKSPSFGTGAQTGMMQSYPPFPYMASGGYPGMSGFQSSNFPMSMGNSLGSAGSFQPSLQSPNAGNIDPETLYQILTAQGVDPNVVMQAMNYAGGASSNVGNSGFGIPSSVSQNLGSKSNVKGSSKAKVQPKQTQETEPVENDVSEVESFFNFLTEMDDDKCISRLICDIGQEPAFLGDFSENIHSMVGTMNVQPSSRAYPYIEIMERGRKEGRCAEKFSECGDMSYEVVKNVAPSVGIPENVDINAVNNL